MWQLKWKWRALKPASPGWGQPPWAELSIPHFPRRIPGMPEPTEKAMPNFPLGQGGWWQLLCLVHAGWYAVRTNPCPGPSLRAAGPTLRVSPSTPSGRATVGTLCAWVAGACLWPDSDILAWLEEAKSTPVNQETETRALVTPAMRSLLQTRRHPSNWQDQVPAPSPRGQCPKSRSWPVGSGSRGSIKASRTPERG